MANSTRSAQAAKEMEDRISQRMDNRLMELATTLQETLTLSMKDTMQELLTQPRGEGPMASQMRTCRVDLEQGLLMFVAQG